MIYKPNLFKNDFIENFNHRRSLKNDFWDFLEISLCLTLSTVISHKAWLNFRLLNFSLTSRENGEGMLINLLKVFFWGSDLYWLPFIQRFCTTFSIPNLSFLKLILIRRSWEFEMKSVKFDVVTKKIKVESNTYALEWFRWNLWAMNTQWNAYYCVSCT